MDYMKRSESDAFYISAGKTGDKLSVTLINERRHSAVIKVISENSIELRAPFGFDARMAREWLEEPTLAARLNKLISSRRDELTLINARAVGGYFYFLGEKLPIHASNSSEFYIADGALFAPSSASKDELADYIFKLYAEEAKKLLPPIVQGFADIKHVTVGRITIRHNRSRWGSCSDGGSLSFTAELMAYPKAVIEYVALHEICHRLHMDHSRDFWAEVAAIMPDYKVRRSALKTRLAPRE